MKSQTRAGTVAQVRARNVAGVVASLLVALGIGAAPAPAAVCGDADGSAGVTVTDGVYVLRAASGLELCALPVCDMNASASVTVTDGVQVLRKAAKLTAEQLCSCQFEGSSCESGGCCGPDLVCGSGICTAIPTAGATVRTTIDSDAPVQELSVGIDYRTDVGEFVGSGVDVNCVTTSEDPFIAIDDDQGELTVQLQAVDGDLQLPIDVTCEFTSADLEEDDLEGRPIFGNFGLTIGIVR